MPSTVNGADEMPSGSKVAAWLGLGAVVYVALGLVGRATIPDGEVLSLVWPAAGVAMLMFGLAPRRWWWLAALLVAAAALPVNFFTGASASQAAVFAVSNVCQGVVAVLLLQALAPRLLGAGGNDPLERLQDFWAVLGSCVIAALAGAVIGSVGRGLLGDWTWGTVSCGGRATRPEVSPCSRPGSSAWRPGGRLRRPGERPSCERIFGHGRRRCF